jgi:hypothetical protein
MASMSHERVLGAPPRPRLLETLAIPELWAGLSIVTMWLAVLFDAIFGPDIVSTSASGSTTVPSAVAVAFFALFATIAVARAGFRRRP